MFDKIEAYLTAEILKYLAQPTGRYAPFYAPDPEVVRNALQPGDILLIEGNCAAESPPSNTSRKAPGRTPRSMSANGRATCRDTASRMCCWRRKPIPASSPCRCRNMSASTPGFAAPWASTPPSRQKVIDYALKRIGTKYNSQRIIDLARYLFPYPPVPVWFRRRMLSIGCGDPTRAICSTLIAQAFASIHYPILPERASINGKTYGIAPYVQSEMDHIRTYGLYTPRDFDVSPFFAIVKPTLAAGFDYRTVQWGPPEVSPIGFEARRDRALGLNTPLQREAT